jgi:hypothetical protein
MCMIDDAESWQFFDHVERKARKPHQCFECGRMIQPGERYEYSSGKLYGYRTFEQFHQCAHCRQVTRWLIVACSGFLFGAVREDLAEHVVGEEMYLRSAPLTRLLRWMSASWKDRDGNLRPVEDVRAVTDAVITAFKAMEKAA